jgi:hypothetical protein
VIAALIPMRYWARAGVTVAVTASSAASRVRAGLAI